MPDRLPTEDFYHPATDQASRSSAFATSLIDNVRGSGAAALGMSPREAKQVDPQQME